jgi:hypothetical protein
MFIVFVEQAITALTPKIFIYDYINVLRLIENK